jgi:putative membrane protein
MSTIVESMLIMVPAILYAAGVRALWARAGRGHGVSRARAASFAAGLIVTALALLSPLDAMSDALFSAHMTQHLLLIMVAAPLCVLGAPLLPMLWAFPAARRRALAACWHRARWMQRVVRGVTQPGSAFLLHFVMLWFWHFPRPYQAAVEHEPLHALEHLCFMGSAMLLWWVALQPIGRRRASEGSAILLMGGTLMQSGVLGAVLMFAQSPWYPVHAAGTRAWGTTLLEDQQLAGLLMWIPASVVYLAAAAWLFLRWMRADERREDRATGNLRIARTAEGRP